MFFYHLNHSLYILIIEIYYVNYKDVYFVTFYRQKDTFKKQKNRTNCTVFATLIYLFTR